MTVPVGGDIGDEVASSPFEARVHCPGTTG